MTDTNPVSTRQYALSDFDFDLPPALIAQQPTNVRSASRLLDGRHLPCIDRHFVDLPNLLRPNDLLIFNDTRVVKARLFGRKPTGGQLEILVERLLPPTKDFEPQHQVAAHLRVSKKPPPGTVLHMDGGFTATLLGRWPDDNGSLFRLAMSDDPQALMRAHGHVPLPPYIQHSNLTEDEARYQTVFAQHPGAAAAPTAALHFDASVLASLQDRGIDSACVTLHVGAGTFAPVKTECLTQHRMHSEWYDIPAKTIAAIDRCRAQKGRVIAVGTTCVRTLETWARSGVTQGDTDIFITPGFSFRMVDGLLTNFHLPKSTLLMLVAAFTGFEHMHTLYRHAIEQRYRFFSYGDCMLLQRTQEAL